jgi:tripartite-type tricarboxylate transporter receptor subunit TctC
MAPAGTPAAVVGKLNAAINAEMKSAEMQRTLANVGAIPGHGTAEEFGAFIAAEHRKWTAVAAAAGIRID